MTGPYVQIYAFNHGICRSKTPMIKQHFTEKDVINNMITAEKKFNKMTAKEIMSSPLIKIEYTTTLKEILDMMHKQEIRRLVVVKEGKIVGIVTERRILEALM